MTVKGGASVHPDVPYPPGVETFGGLHDSLTDLSFQKNRVCLPLTQTAASDFAEPILFAYSRRGETGQLSFRKRIIARL